MAKAAVDVDALFEPEQEQGTEPLYDRWQGMHGRSGIYSDEVSYRERIDRSALIEGVEPDYTIPVTADELRRFYHAEPGAEITAPIIGYK